MTNIASNLKSLRKAKKMTQQRVAFLNGLTRSTYSGYENNVAEPPLCVVVRLAEFYKTPIDIISISRYK